MKFKMCRGNKYFSMITQVMKEEIVMNNYNRARIRNSNILLVIFPRGSGINHGGGKTLTLVHVPPPES